VGANLRTPGAGKRKMPINLYLPSGVAFRAAGGVNNSERRRLFAANHSGGSTRRLSPGTGIELSTECGGTFSRRERAAEPKF